MEELDLLKKDWQKANAFEQISESEIYKMLHKKSSSIVRWIVIVSVLELSFGFLMSILLSFTKNDYQNEEKLKLLGIYNYYIVITAVLYVVVFYFIYNFYKMYKKISVDDTVKQLINNILKTRKVVKQYIAFNLISFALLFITVLSYGIYMGFINEQIKKGIANPEISIKTFCFMFAIAVGVTTIFTLLFWLFYKLLYGILLKKLNRNYLELKKIEL